MKKLIALVLILVCVLGLFGCGQQQSFFGENKIEGISQEKVEEIALEQCKVNYDYIKTEFNYSGKRWSVEFWENIGKIPTQTVLIDTEGNVISIRYAE